MFEKRLTIFGSIFLASIFAKNNNWFLFGYFEIFIILSILTILFYAIKIFFQHCFKAIKKKNPPPPNFS